MPTSKLIDWTSIDTVLLDMDGTLLDLNFDNHFWLDLVPKRYAEIHGIDIRASLARLKPKFRAVEGTLDWYSTDYWSRELGFDVMTIKNDVREGVVLQPGAADFLARLATLGKRRVLLTNAHPRVLAIKDAQVGLARHFETMYSTHPFGLPKEHPDFWARFHEREPFEADRTFLADDSVPVLRAAQAFGVRWLCQVLRPDSTQSRRDAMDFAAVDYLADLAMP